MHFATIMSQHNRLIFATVDYNPSGEGGGAFLSGKMVAMHLKFQFSIALNTSRDKNMGLLVQFSTTFTSHLICTPQP